ncbi:MAG: type II CAAX endopeptidase family protein [Candidatus Izemoplasmatales bacterium]
MNDYDDLFDKDPKIEQELITKKTTINNDYANDFYERAKEDKRNGFIIMVYILVQILTAFVVPLILSANYSYLEESIEAISNPNPIIFSVEENINSSTGLVDETNQYIVLVTGTFKNEYTKVIPVFRTKIDFFDKENVLIGTFYFTEENFEPNKTFTIDEKLFSNIEPIEISTSVEADAPSMFYTLASLLSISIVAAGIFYIDKINFKKNWIAFKANPKHNILQILGGFAYVYFALIIANLILTAVGVSETSQNEMTIQSLFNNNPLNLFFLFLLLCVVTPIVEEVVYRKVIYNFIEPRSNYKVAIVMTGLIFGLMHVISYGDFIQAIPYVFMGLVFGYIYWKSNKNIYVVYGVHFLNNFLSWLLYVLAIYGVIGL